MITDYVKGQCLSLKSFSQFGGSHQRNLLTLKQTNSYLLVCMCLIYLDNGLISLFQLFRFQLDKNTQFIIHSMLWVVSLHIFFGLYVPGKHIILSRHCLPCLWWEDKTVQTNQFYVRQPSMSPRRLVETNLLTKDYSKRGGKKSLAIFKSTRNKTPPFLNKIQIHKLDQNFSTTNVKHQLPQPQ
jgi:hypothetical protein